MKGPRVPGWVWAAVIAGHVLALGWTLAMDRWSFPDSGRYLQAAQNVWEHGQLYARAWPGSAPQGKGVQEFTIRTPGYPLVVLGLGGMVAPPVILLLVQNLLSLLVIGLVLNWWLRWGRPTAKQWLWAVGGILTFPAQFIYPNAVMSEAVLQAMIMAMLVAAVLYIDQKKERYAAGFVAALVLALLIKPVFYPMGIAVTGAGLIAAWWRRRTGLAALALVPVLVVGLYMSWNAQRTGYFHFSSITDINLLHYNAAGVMRQLGGSEAEEQWVAGVLAEANGKKDFATRQQVIQARAGAVIRAHPMVYARQHLLGMATFFLDPGRFDVSEFLGLEAPPGGGLLAQLRAGGLLRTLRNLPVGLLGWLGLVVAANAGRLWLAWRGFRRLGQAAPVWRKGRWVVVGLLLYVAVLTGPLGAARFLVPVWPLLLGLALAGLRRNSLSEASATTAGASE
jgi:hypothetical protein